MQSHNVKPASFQEELHSLHKRLTSLKSLRPNKETDALFTELVDFVLHREHSLDDLQLLKDGDSCRDFHSICSEAEAHLEAHWAQCLISGEKKLSDFPYMENYIKLVRMEYHLLRGQGARPHRIMFIGSGPLPLSSLVLANQHLAHDANLLDWSILNVDQCPEANKLAREVSRKLWPDLGNKVSFLECDAAAIKADTVKESDVIYLAALVGLEAKDKERIARSLVQHMKPGSRLLMRSAAGLRCLLYPAIDEKAFLRAFAEHMELEVVSHPHTSVINSVVIARRL